MIALFDDADEQVEVKTEAMVEKEVKSEQMLVMKTEMTAQQKEAYALMLLVKLKQKS